MYDLKFIFEECGFDWVPPHIDRSLLFNVSFDLDDGEIKLYVLDHTRDFLYKIDRTGIAKQFDAMSWDSDPNRLSALLGAPFDYNDVIIDTLQDDVFYVFIEETSPAQYTRFLESICLKYALPVPRLIDVINRINEKPIATLQGCCANRSVSLVKVPLYGNSCKVYSRPFKMGNGFRLPANAAAFLARLFNCDPTQLPQRLLHGWVSTELFSGRVTITTQYNQLLHS